MEIFKNLKKSKWFLSGFIVLGWVVMINHFPSEHIILGGDVFQPTKVVEQYAGLHYGWFSGRVSLFYGLFYFLDGIGISASGQLSWYLGLFLFSAYTSFWLFAKLIFPMTAKPITALMSLFYATNVYTLYIFTATWGFTSYQVVYVFIPALVGLYLKILVNNEKKYFLWFFLVMSFASMSFSNPAFAVSLALSFILLTFVLFLFRYMSPSFLIFKKISILVLGALLLNAYWILPLLPQMQAGIQEISISTDIVLTETLQKTSNAIFDTLRLLPTHEQKIYYPYNFPYPDLSFIKQIVVFLTFVPFLLVIVGMVLGRGNNKKGVHWSFLALFIIFVALIAKVRPPFELFNSLFFQLPGFNALRGWDKLAIYTPFLLSALLLGLFSSDLKKKYLLMLLVTFCFSASLLALPFYAGGIQTKLSYILSGNKKKDYTTAGHSALIKIPAPYFSAEEVLKSGVSESKISMLPFSPGSSVGRVDLPVLKINGPHPANALYAKKYLELNDYYFSKWIFAKEFTQSQLAPDWIIDLYGLLGVEYIFYHHDAKPKSLKDFELIREYFEQKGAVNVLMDNQWFTLYRINEEYLFPYVYVNSSKVIIEPRVESVSANINNFRLHMVPLAYEKIHSKEVIVPATGMQSSDESVYLNERYDPLWRAEYVLPEGHRIPLIRNSTVRYANAWYLDSSYSKSNIDMYYIPTKLLFIGELISGATLSLVIICGVLILRRRKKVLN